MRRGQSSVRRTSGPRWRGPGRWCCASVGLPSSTSSASPAESLSGLIQDEGEARLAPTTTLPGRGRGTPRPYDHSARTRARHASPLLVGAAAVDEEDLAGD